MAHLLRNAPRTPLDALRALLAGYAPEDGAFHGRLHHLLQVHRRQLFRELGGRLCQATAPKGLKKAIFAQAQKFDWPEWTPWILQALQQEGDLGTFDEGCTVLGALATREAHEALERLLALRSDPDRQVILHRELGHYRSQQATSHYLSRLMEGQGNVKLAHQGAKVLAACAEPRDLPALVEAHRNGDALTQRLAMRIIASLGTPEVNRYLLDTLDEACTEFTDLQAISETQRRIGTLGRAAAKPEFIALILERFGSRVPGVADCLERAGKLEGAEAGLALEPLRAEIHGACERFLVESLGLLLEGKVARYAAYQSETSDFAEVRIPHLSSLCDQVAEALAYRIDLDLATYAEASPVFLKTLRARLGGDGFIQAFLRMLPAEETSVLEELLADPDIGRRQRYLNALGSREDDALVPFFLKAMQDPIVDVGILAIHHLGKLPSSHPALMALFESHQPDQVRMAIRVFGENHTRLAAEPLLDFVQKDNRDDVLVEAVEALANICFPAGAPVLLDMLHDGKPLNLQLALARALGRMGTEEASLGLLRKSATLKQPQVLVLALEGALTAFPAFEKPLPAEHVPALLQLADRCFDEREGEGQRLRAMLALQDFYAFDKDAYERLKDLFSGFLFDMRIKENWDRESNDKVSAVVKELARRSASLGLIARKEANVLARLEALPPKGPKRAEALLALRDALQDPELILRPEIARTLADVVRRELGGTETEWREVAHLCEIGGLTRQADLIEPVRLVFERAKGLGLKSAARSALANLGLSDADLHRRPPIHSILVIEPSAFFRKRLVASLASADHWRLAEAGSRGEAEDLMRKASVDLVLTELHDPEGEMGPWLEEHWECQHFRYALLSTASRDLGPLAEAPWLLGALYKPYPMDQLLRALES